MRILVPGPLHLFYESHACTFRFIQDPRQSQAVYLPAGPDEGEREGFGGSSPPQQKKKKGGEKKKRDRERGEEER